jgi:hypothetical protein
VVTWLLMMALAQEPAAPAQMVEVDPIRCWWRTSAGAVRIGETFTVGLTCAVLEAEGVQVVPDESQLADTAIQLNPFEVVSGSHPPDLRSGQRRFFQYEYVVRVINPDVIGQDVPLPNVVVHYRVNSRLPGNAAMEGRDLSYLLPPHKVRVLSLVPADAADIRDQSGENFARVESLDVRAGMFEIAATALIALGSLMVIVSLVALARGRRQKTDAVERTLPEWRTLSAVRGELADVGREVDRQGWTDVLAGRALAATRVVAASALGRRITQARVERTMETGQGRIVMRGLRPAALNRGRGATAVSSYVTAEDVRREIARLPADAPAAHRQRLESLAAALVTFTAAGYGQTREWNRSELDAALASAGAAAATLRNQRLWRRGPAPRSIAGLPVAERQA